MGTVSKKLEELRRYWKIYKEQGDLVMCGVIERRARALKLSQENKNDEFALKVIKSLS